MARRKIVPEEEVSKPAMAEETTATDVDDEAPADLMPDSNAEESATSEAVPTETLLEGINGNDAEGSVQAEKSESISAEKASEEAMSVEDASVSEEELPAGSEHADASIEEVTTEPESASDALSEAAILCDADEDGNSVSDMVPQEISELHDEAEEAAEYSVDFSEEPETVSPESTPISSTEESDWGFQEPKCSATSFLRNWDSILEKKRANLRSISEPARLRQPPPPEARDRHTQEGRLKAYGRSDE